MAFSNNYESSESVRPRKQRKSPAFWRTPPFGSPTLGLNDGDGVKERAVSVRPTSPSPRHSPFPRDTGPPQDRAGNSRNHILEGLVNGLAEESDHSDNNKDGENIMDEGKAENYSDGSDDSGDTDDDAGDGDSDSDEGNEARGCAGRRGSPTPISGQSKPKRAAKHHLQRSHRSPSASPIHNRLRTRKPLLSSASSSDSNKVIPGAALNADSEEILIRAAFRRQEDGSYILDILPQQFHLPGNLVKQPQKPKPQGLKPQKPKSRVKFTKEEDTLLIKLKEEQNLSWEQIKDRFPKRSPGSLQAHYCSKLKAQPAVQKTRGRPAGRKRRQ
ncbi:hypothetical protein AOQ84DRAFT_417177 [Glonium stellatum]|uniref:Myb-like domain-containing protein n=1 Tax=Glonium stellatum TaxID=574774 RepID=A0A8E2ETH1_9PEZI|nr:hypothetical protein AOQ84DRAFT_417177 [Glonium stellatum]